MKSITLWTRFKLLFCKKLYSVDMRNGTDKSVKITFKVLGGKTYVIKSEVKE